MSIEQLLPVNRAPPRETTLADALLEQYEQKAGTATNPDEYLETRGTSYTKTNS